MKIKGVVIFSFLILGFLAPAAQAQMVWWMQAKQCLSCDLRGLNLSGLDLTNFNLTGANLAGANLSGTILLGANLTNVNFQGATLNNAVLTRANLSGVNFEQADLRGATLYRSTAREPFNLTGAKLKYTQMPKGNIYNDSRESNLP